jgi:uncharacterized membrane protein YcaP (DUF421 family)
MDINTLVGANQALSIAVKAIAFYVYMVVLLRISGKRTTMSMTSFDFVSTVAIATIIGSTILQESISLLEGMVAVTVLVGMQWAAGSVSARSRRIRHFITSAPSLLYQNGQYLEKNLAAERISREQLMQKIRAAGHAGTTTVKAVVLESAGSVSVIEVEKSRDELDLRA